MVCILKFSNNFLFMNIISFSINYYIIKSDMTILSSDFDIYK